MKKLLSVMFVALLIAALLPVVASAEIVKSGTCGKNGDNLTWMLDDEGTLTISGTGEMEDYSSNNAPWKGKTVKNVVIEDGVTSIGDCAFRDCTSLTSINIPDSVTEIDNSAFSGCNAKRYANMDSDGAKALGRAGYSFRVPGNNYDLKYLYDETTITGIEISNVDKDVVSFSIPDGVTSIGGGAFYKCSSLTSLSIPKGVTRIGNSAFSGCSSLTSVTIPDDVTIIGSYAFYKCSNLTSLSIPKGVTSIGNFAFYGCSSLTSVTIPDDVTIIGDQAFSDCSAKRYANIDSDGAKALGKANYSFRNPGNQYDLRYEFDYYGTFIGIEISNVDRDAVSISIPDGVTSIGDSAFNYCSRLTSVNIPDGVTSIGIHAFDDCSSLTSVNIPNGVISISDWAFCSCSSLASVSIPDSVNSIGFFAFGNCSSLKSVSIPDGVTSVDGSAFHGCSVKLYSNMDSDGAKALSRFYTFRVPDVNYDLKYLYKGNTITGLEIVSADEDAISVCIPDGVTSIGNSAFSGCRSLTSISIPDSVTSIGTTVFKNCSSLTSVSIPDRVTSVECSAFDGCSARRYANMDSDSAKALSKAYYSFRVPGNNYDLRYLYNSETITEIEISSVDKDAENIIIPDGVTSIGGNAFSDCSSLTSVAIPGSVTRIGWNAFSGCKKLNAFNVSSDNTVYASKEGILYTHDMSTLFACPGGKTSVTIPDGVTIIGDNAFAYCSSLTSITIPDGVTSIGDWAFVGCSAKRYANMDSEGAKALSKAGYGFRLSDTNYDLKYLYDYNNTTITGIALSKVDKDAVSVIVPDIVTSIGDSAFSGCTRLRSIQLPDGITSFKTDCFKDCNAKRYANIGSETAINLGKAGYGFDVPEANYVLGYLSGDPERLALISVYGNSASLTIPDGVKELEDRVLELFPKVIIPASVTKIHKNSYIPLRFLGLVVYCYEFTYAEEWAKENNCQIIYMDNVIPEDIRTVAFPRESMRLACGDAVELNANVFPMVSPQDIVWSNSNPSVASIEDGELTALKPGTTTITATVGKASASIEIITYNRATGFTIPEEVWFVAKDSVTLPVTDIQPERGELVLTWKSADASLVQVDENGVVTGNIADKDATITATTDNGISRQCVAHVCYPVTAVAFNEHQVTMREIDRVQLTANVTARTRSLVNKLVTFTSADESVAKVDENGRVTAMGPGTTTVTATAASGVSDSITVTVQGTLSLLRLPADLEVIEDEAFMGLPCEAVIIPEGCTAIGARAFANCKALTYVRIPASVKTIAEDAFEGCDKAVIDRAD